ncbi:MAG: hypothetical protein ABDH49_04120 [Candidatus Hydrothermales bacterium]
MEIVELAGKVYIEEGAKVEGGKVILNPGPIFSLLKILSFIGKGVFIKREKPESVVEEKEEIEEYLSVETEELPSKNFFNFLWFIILVLFYSFLVFLVKIIFPGTVENMKRELELRPFLSLALGFLVQILYFPIILILIVSILGIPLALMILLLTPFFLIYGSSPFYFYTSITGVSFIIL